MYNNSQNFWWKQHVEPYMCCVYIFFCQVARVTSFSIHLLNCSVLKKMVPNELESYSFPRDDILRRKFMLEVLQIRGQSNETPGIVPNTVGCIVVNSSSKTGGQCTAYSVIPVSSYLTRNSGLSKGQSLWWLYVAVKILMG